MILLFNNYKNITVVVIGPVDKWISLQKISRDYFATCYYQPVEPQYSLWTSYPQAVLRVDSVGTSM